MNDDKWGKNSRKEPKMGNYIKEKQAKVWKFSYCAQVVAGYLIIME